MMLHLEPHHYERVRRPVTSRRLAAAARAIEKQKHRHPLFAFEITQTPEERVDEMDASCLKTRMRLRRWYAGCLKNLRLVWISIPFDEQKALEAVWRDSNYPKTASYALGWLKDRGYCSMHGQLIEGKFIVKVYPLGGEIR